jgi:hypothetical protein
MPRPILFLIVLVLLLVGGTVLLSMNASEVPTEPIEAEVSRDSTSQ